MVHKQPKPASLSELEREPMFIDCQRKILKQTSFTLDNVIAGWYHALRDFGIQNTTLGFPIPYGGEHYKSFEISKEFMVELIYERYRL